MQPIKKLDISITDKVVIGYNDLTKWQISINDKGEDDSLENLVEKSQKPTANGGNLWGSVPKEKANLAIQLYKEQKGVCCYCGQQLNPDKIVIEHLNPKESFPAMVFDYQNLYASCEGGHPIEKTIYPDKTTVREIALEYQVDIKNISIPRLPNFSLDTEIPAKTAIKIKLGKREDLHCDAHKDKDKIFVQPIFYDKLVSNPHKPENDYQIFSCLGKISYYDDGRVLIENQDEHQTIGFLNLNYDKLKKKRAKVYDNVQDFLENLETDNSQELIDFAKKEITRLEGMSLQENFAFVRIYFLQETVNKLS
jgi:hypothetical protein